MSSQFRKRLYQFIIQYLEENGTSPSFRDITQAMMISPRSKSLITRSLRLLEKEGLLILKKEGRRLLLSLPTKNRLPLMGRIAAGLPIEAIESCEFIDIENFYKTMGDFALEVKGDSMIDEGILDGDIILCKKIDIAPEGAIVIALIEGTNVTLKKISYQKKDFITLLPANAALKPQVYAPDSVKVQGIYVGLIRSI